MGAMPMPAAQLTICSSDQELRFLRPWRSRIPAGLARYSTWTNLDGEPHTITNVDGLFRSGAIDQGESYTFRFDRPGVYAYLCSIHPKMRATVTVK